MKKRFPFGPGLTVVQSLSCSNRKMLPRLLPLFIYLLIYFPPQGWDRTRLFCHEKITVPEPGLGLGSSMTTGAASKRHPALAAKEWRAGLTFLLFFFYSLNTPFTHEQGWSDQYCTFQTSSSYGFPVLNKKPHNTGSLQICFYLQSSNQQQSRCTPPCHIFGELRCWHT